MIGEGQGELQSVTDGETLFGDQKESRHGDVPGDPGTPVGFDR